MTSPDTETSTPSCNGVPVHVEDIRLIAEAGFLAATRGQVAYARTIFENLMVLRPNYTLPYIGLAVTALAEGRPDEACRVLARDGLQANPGNGEIKAFLGLALMQAGRRVECAAVTRSVVEQDDLAAPHVCMAVRLLAEATTDAVPPRKASAQLPKAATKPTSLS